MAIIIEEEKNSNPWFTVVIVLFILAILGAGTYYLFFNPVPGIEKVIVSPELKTISEISKVNLDVATVTESPIYKSLNRDKKVPEPDLGTILGRSNPFLPF